LQNDEEKLVDVQRILITLVKRTATAFGCVFLGIVFYLLALGLLGQPIILETVGTNNNITDQLHDGLFPKRVVAIYIKVKECDNL
jgi:hypothetical protein